MNLTPSTQPFVAVGRKIGREPVVSWSGDGRPYIHTAHGVVAAELVDENYELEIDHPVVQMIDATGWRYGVSTRPGDDYEIRPVDFIQVRAHGRIDFIRVDEGGDWEDVLDDPRFLRLIHPRINDFEAQTLVQEKLLERNEKQPAA